MGTAAGLGRPAGRGHFARTNPFGHGRCCNGQTSGAESEKPPRVCLGAGPLAAVSARLRAARLRRPGPPPPRGRRRSQHRQHYSSSTYSTLPVALAFQGSLITGQFRWQCSSTLSITPSRHDVRACKTTFRTSHALGSRLCHSGLRGHLLECRARLCGPIVSGRVRRVS